MAVNLKGDGHSPAESTFPKILRRLMKTINVDENREHCIRYSKFQENRSYKDNLNAFCYCEFKYIDHATETGTDADVVNSKTNSSLCGSKAGTSPSEKLRNHTSIRDQRSLKKDFIQLLFFSFFTPKYF
jgi:hypothetical protein